MVIHELQEPLPVEVKHLGKGLAILIECGTNDYKWTIVFESRAIVSVAQSKVLVQKDFTNNRGITAKQLAEIIGRVRDDYERGQPKEVQVLERKVGRGFHARRWAGLRMRLERDSRDARCKMQRRKSTVGRTSAKAKTRKAT